MRLTPKLWLARHRRNRARRRLIAARRTIHLALDRLDEDMARAGYGRHERRQMWRELIAGRVDPREIVDAKPVRR